MYAFDKSFVCVSIVFIWMNWNHITSFWFGFFLRSNSSSQNSYIIVLSRLLICTVSICTVSFNHTVFLRCFFIRFSLFDLCCHFILCQILITSRAIWKITTQKWQKCAQIQMWKWIYNHLINRDILINPELSCWRMFVLQKFDSTFYIRKVQITLI